MSSRGRRNYDYSHKTGSEQGLRDDKKRTRNFLLIACLAGGILLAVLLYLAITK